MLDKDYILEKMKKHFPRWMDIHKRVKTSNGGAILTSLAEEISFIEDAIEEYKKDFFIEAYHDRTEDIVSLTKRCYIGEVSLVDLKLISPTLEVTPNIKTFYQSDEVLYQEGFLYFKLDQVKDLKEINYQILSHSYYAPLDFYHVWNVFDEFAGFVGLKRHEFETNSDLEKRILNVFRQRPNASETGLKNALFNDLMILDSDLVLDEIVIEGVTPENLSKQYDEFTTVIEKLAFVNRDVYRTKRWNVDVWNWPLKSISYIPHFWDVALAFYEDGVGKKDDLKVSVSTKSDKVDVNLNYYKKDTKKIETYLENKIIDTKIPIELIKYKENLDPEETILSIKANEIIDITTKNIKFECMSSTQIEDTINLFEIVDQSRISESVQVTDNRTLEPGKHRIELDPTSSLSDFTLHSCTLEKPDGRLIDLLKDINNQYYTYKDGMLSYNYLKFFCKTLNSYTSQENAIQKKEGIEIASGERTAKLIKNCMDIAGERIMLDYTCPMHPIDYKQSCKVNGFILEDNKFVQNHFGDGMFVEINTICNDFSLDISGDSLVEVVWNSDEETKVTETIIANNETVTFKNKNQLLKSSICRITIKPMYSMSKVTVSNILINVFDILLSCSKGELFISNNTIYFPEEHDDNSLEIQLVSKSQFSPMLKGVFCGVHPYSFIGDNGLIQIEFESQENDKLNLSARNYMARKYMLNNSNEVIDSIGIYNPKITYRALKNDAMLFLDFKNRFTLINDITGNGVKYGYDGSDHYLKLSMGKEVSEVHISAIRTVSEANGYLTDLFELNSEESLFVTNLHDGFCIRDNKTKKQRLVNLKTVEGFEDYFKEGVFRYYNLPIELSPVYVQDFRRRTNIGINIDRETFTGSIKDSYLYIPGSIDHVAYNKHKIFSPIQTVEVIDTFRPFLNTSKQYAYEITNPNQNLEIYIPFTSEEKPNFTIGQPDMFEIRWPYDPKDKDLYTYERIQMELDLRLGRIMKLPETLKVKDLENSKLSHYVLNVDKDYEIIYDTVNDTVDGSIDKPELYEMEYIKISDQGFSKLLHCNIDQIVYIGTRPQINDSNGDLRPNDYELLKDQGIIVLKKDIEHFYIKYTYKNPYAIKVLSDDLLYDKVPKNGGQEFDAYLADGRKEFLDLTENEFIDMENDHRFNKTDYIIVADFSAPNFEAVIDKEKKGIWIRRIIQEEAIAIQSGYYYIEGDEYYMLIDSEQKTEDKSNNVITENVIKDKGQWILKESTNNFITNSVMGMGAYAEIFNQNFEHTNNLKGASSLNAITACDSYNHWKAVGMSLSFEKGHNDIGLKLTPRIKDGYLLLKITDRLFDQTRISMYADENVEVFLGVSRIAHNDKNFVLIEDRKFERLIGPKPLLQYNLLEKDSEKDYYLVVKGSGVVDDIMCLDLTSTHGKWDYHAKNIDTVGFEVPEIISDDHIQRIKFAGRTGFLAEGTEILSNGYIVNSPIVKWDYTLHTRFVNHMDWAKCKLTNLSTQDNIVLADMNKDGLLETNPIYLGNLSVINSVKIVVNEVETSQTTNLSTTVLNCSTNNGLFVDYMTDVTQNEIILKPNTRHQDLKPYIKLKIKVPTNKVVTSLHVFVEYKSTDENAPIETMSGNGSFITEIYDAFTESNYELQSVLINSVSNIDHVDISIRGAKANSTDIVWTDWKSLIFDKDLKIVDSCKYRFKNYRYFQLKIILKSKDAFVDIEHIDMKVVNN